MLAASEDPAGRAALPARRLHPAPDDVTCSGTPTRRSCRCGAVREGSIGDVDLLNSSTGRCATAPTARPRDPHQVHRLVVADRSTGSGYVYVPRSGAPHLLAATNRRTATGPALGGAGRPPPDQPVSIDHITAGNEWAIDVEGWPAGAGLPSRGYLALRDARRRCPTCQAGQYHRRVAVKGCRCDNN